MIYVGALKTQKSQDPSHTPVSCFATFVVRSCDLILAKAWTCTCTWLHRHCESIVSRSSTVADLRGARGTHAPSWGPKFFQFHAVFGKIWQNRMLAPPPPGELALPPRGNPGSATGVWWCAASMHLASIANLKTTVNSYLSINCAKCSWRSLSGTHRVVSNKILW